MIKTRDQGKDEVAKLSRYFATNQQVFAGPGVKEAHVRQTLIDPFFEALGWDVANRAMAAPQYREVIPEDSLEVEGERKAPDYAFRVGTLPKFFAEAKKCAVKIATDVKSTYQLRRYGWSAKVGLSLLTNFEQLSVFDCSNRPRASDKATRGRILHFSFNDYVARWDELWDVFSREAVWSGAFDAFVASKRKRGTSQVDDEFLKEIEAWRESLARNIALRNELGPEDLNSAVQSTIDRVVFLRMAEDRGLEPYEQLLNLCSRNDIYARFMRDVCRRADDKYNSGLFHFQKEPGVSEPPDRTTPKLVVDDKVFKPIVQSLYFSHGSPYHFGVMPVEILGTVYERFLGKVIRLTPSGQAKVEKKPELRKARGVYYTPAYIVDYVVRHTVAPQIRDRSPAQLAGKRNGKRPFCILDMACGSGSFLLGAYQCMLDHYLKWYIDHKPESHKRAVYNGRRTGEWRLTIEEKKQILTTHIFGVDIDRQAVEVTKLSLLLKVLEGETDQSVSRQLQLFHERALPNLADNIKCGNSLVGSGYALEEIQPDVETLQRVNPFDWTEQFPQVLQSGGFDCIIGNPPYAYRNATEEMLRPYYLAHYKGAEGNFDLYKFFLERGLELTRASGRLGMIVSGTFMVQPTFTKLRELLLCHTIRRLAPLGPKAFANATVDTAIVVCERKKPSSPHKIAIQAPINAVNLPTAPEYAIEQRRFVKNEGFIFDYRLRDEGARIVDRLFSNFPPVEVGYEFGVGINTGYIKDDLTADRRIDQRYHPMVAGDGISRYGPVHTTGWIMYDKEYVKSRGSLGRTLPDERLLNSEKILVVRTRNLSLGRRIIATLDRSRSYNLNRLSNIIARPTYELAGLLGILNSRLFNWLFSTRFFDYEIKPVYLRKSPLADSNSPELIRNVEQTLTLNKELNAAKAVQHRDVIKRQIAATDAQIDRMVFDLYGLASKEIDLIEESTA